jgi:hypothetical protein
MGLVEVVVVTRFTFGSVRTALDGRSKVLLAASIKALPTRCRVGSPTRRRSSSSPINDDYAFGEMDEAGKADIANFAAQVTPRWLC